MGPMFIGPFRVVAKVGKVVYELDYLDELSQNHHTFQVSQLRKCVADSTFVVLLEDIQVDGRMYYVEWSVVTMDRNLKSFAEQGSEIGQSSVAALEGLRVDLGA